jgi:hypothetical protein
MQHNAWSFEVSESVHTMGAQRIKDQEKINRMGLFLQHLLQYADEGEGRYA